MAWGAPEPQSLDFWFFEGFLSFREWLDLANLETGFLGGLLLGAMLCVGVGGRNVWFGVVDHLAESGEL